MSSLCLSFPLCSMGLPPRVASRLRSGNSESTVPQSLFLSSPKDTSGGDSCTSEEEPTFDPGYEPDWAVISTVRPRHRHSEPTRGRLSCCPWGGGRWRHDLPSVVMAPWAVLPTVKMATHSGLQSQESGWGVQGGPQPRSSVASVSEVCSLAHQAGLPDWLWAPPRKSCPWNFQGCGGDGCRVTG